MESLSKDHIKSVVNTIWSQLVATTSPDIIGSWGLSSLSATQIVKKINGYDLAMAALVLTVEGFIFQGQVYVALDEGSDYYRIYFNKDGILQEQRADIAFEELGSTIDALVETGNLSPDEYDAKVTAEYGLHIAEMR